MEDTPLLKKTHILIEQRVIGNAAWDDFCARIKPYVNTLARRKLYAVYDAQIMWRILLLLKEEISNYISFIECPAWFGFDREAHENTLTYTSCFLRGSDIFLSFRETPLEQTREEIEDGADALYDLLSMYSLK